MLQVIKLVKCNNFKPHTTVINEWFSAEAIGAIGSIEDSIVKSILAKYKDDPVVEVAETCQLALQRMEWFDKNLSSDKVSPFHSVDPTPPSTVQNVDQLKSVLMDENESLFERYRAMFGLRNVKTDESILALCEGKLSVNSLLVTVAFLFVTITRGFYYGILSVFYHE